MSGYIAVHTVRCSSKQTHGMAIAETPLTLCMQTHELKRKKKKSTLLGVITGTKQPLSSPGADDQSEGLTRDLSNHRFPTTVPLISPVQHVYPCSETRHCKHRHHRAGRHKATSLPAHLSEFDFTAAKSGRSARQVLDKCTGTLQHNRGKSRSPSSRLARALSPGIYQAPRLVTGSILPHSIR